MLDSVDGKNGFALCRVYLWRGCRHFKRKRGGWNVTLDIVIISLVEEGSRPKDEATAPMNE